MIAIIAAVARNGVIGNNNSLPWNLPDDMKLFKKYTSGNTIIMGRKTYESIGRPLPNRNNIVVTRSDIDIENVDVCNSIEEALEKGEEYGKDIFIIGGSSIYEQTMELADRLYISHIQDEFEGDSYFPQFERDDWEVEEEEDYGDFTFRIYRRKI